MNYSIAAESPLTEDDVCDNDLTASGHRPERDSIRRAIRDSSLSREAQFADHVRKYDEFVLYRSEWDKHRNAPSLLFLMPASAVRLLKPS